MEEGKNKKNQTSPEEESPSQQDGNPGLPNSKDLLFKTLNDYGERFWTYLGLVVAPLLVIAFLSLVLIYLFTSVTGLFGLGATTMTALLVMFLIPLIFIVILLLSFWGQAALITALIEGPAPFLDYYKKSAQKLLQYWWVSILIYFAVLGGFFFFGVPGIIFAIWFLFAGIIVIAEDERGFNALSKSREYTRGIWFKVFWRTIFFGLIFGLVIILFNKFIVTILGGVNIVSELLNSAWSIVLAPLLTIYIFNIYKSVAVKERQVESVLSTKLKAGVIASAIVGFLLIPIVLVLVLLSPSSWQSPGDVDSEQTEQPESLFEPEELDNIE